MKKIDYKVIKFIYVSLILITNLSIENRYNVLGCGPGRGFGRRRGPRKLTPLVFKQHVPNVSENTLIASSLPEGRISRGDKRFRDLLVPNYNRDIIFRDEEGTGSDRLMTQRCKERLNTLAIAVMNQWPGIKLRVTEAWDEEGVHHKHSLHYEGRAVDVTTSDRDRSKYGMLARLAVEAGFDWVFYESRAHIHCSVKSESSQATKRGGCFSGNSTTIILNKSDKQETKTIMNVNIGDRVLALNEKTGRFVFSRVILYLDKVPNIFYKKFLNIRTSRGYKLTTTESHLILLSNFQSIFASKLQIGSKILINNQGVLSTDHIVTIDRSMPDIGLYAPLTEHGNIVIDGIVVSCYALIDNHQLAHLVFSPIRLLSYMTSPIPQIESTFMSHQSFGTYWYARFLHSFGHLFVDYYL